MEDSFQFRLLKKEISNSFNDNNSKTQAIVGFGLALEQFSKSDGATKIDLADLFDRLELDPLDKVIFSVRLFSGVDVNPEISSKGKILEGERQSKEGETERENKQGV